jgi:hypothetical protein
MPKAPSSLAVISPRRLIVNSHGSVSRWNALSCGRRPYVNVFQTGGYWPAANGAGHEVK